MGLELAHKLREPGSRCVCCNHLRSRKYRDRVSSYQGSAPYAPLLEKAAVKIEDSNNWYGTLCVQTKFRVSLNADIGCGVGEGIQRWVGESVRCARCRKPSFLASSRLRRILDIRRGHGNGQDCGGPTRSFESRARSKPRMEAPTLARRFRKSYLLSWCLV
jgi:hypothetical protein